MNHALDRARAGAMVAEIIEDRTLRQGVARIMLEAMQAEISARLSHLPHLRLTEAERQDLAPSDPDYLPGCDISGCCVVSDEDEASGCGEAMCILCGGWRHRNWPHAGNWGVWTPDLEQQMAKKLKPRPTVSENRART